MFEAQPSTLLPQYSDEKGRGRANLRSFLSSRRGRMLLALALVLTVSFYFVAFSGPLQTRIYGSSNQVDLNDELPEQSRPPPEPIHNPKPQAPTANSTANKNDGIWKARANQVRDAFVRGYTAYYKHAFPHDELRPMALTTDGQKDNLGGWGATTLDSLDTMLLMGLNDLFNQSVPFVASSTFDSDRGVQFFETVIRYLGGMLSVYAMTKDPLFLARADDLGHNLLGAFNTPQGLPTFMINPKTGKGYGGWAGNVAILSEMASCQMEYRYLAHLTGRPEYVRVVDRITDHMVQFEERGGLYATTFDMNTGHPASNLYSVGAMADSAYEYFLKEWLLTGKTERKYLDMYLRSADAIIKELLYVSPTRRLLYVVDMNRGSMRPDNNLQHLSCFIAGLFALGAATIPNVDPRHAWVAEGLAHTCWITYADSPTGLGPERVHFASPGRKWVDELAEWDRNGKPGGVPPGVNQAVPVKLQEEREYRSDDPRYLLRPETIESFYILWRTTGDPKWRDRGWAMFEAIDKHTRTKDAYASVLDVDIIPTPKDNDLPSFFFAETLKYAYLLFTDEDLVPLDKWVFNTEAHPFPVYKWSEWEKTHFGITAST